MLLIVAMVCFCGAVGMALVFCFGLIIGSQPPEMQAIALAGGMFALMSLAASILEQMRSIASVLEQIR